jgi:uncharacterized protein YceK
MRKVLLPVTIAVLLSGCSGLQPTIDNNAVQIQSVVAAQVTTAQTDLTAAAQTDLNGLKDMVIGSKEVTSALSSALKEINTAGLNALQKIQEGIQARLVRAINLERDRAIAEINVIGGTAAALAPAP